MRPWNLYNASMEIASRCNAVFSKLFIYKVMRMNGIYIDANNRYRFPAMYNIHMIADKKTSKLEFYVNFSSEQADFSKCEDDELDRIAYSLAHGISNRYGVAEGKSGFIFYFDDNLNYKEYENHYEFTVDGETKTIDSDYPMLHHMRTEFDLEFQLFNEFGIKPGLSELKKNGLPVFSESQFMNKKSWGILRVEKGDNGYIVNLQDSNFFSRGTYNIKILSYFGQYSSLEVIPMLSTKKDSNPYVELFFSANEYDYLVYVERIRNYGLSPMEMKEAFMAYCNYLGADKNINWADFFFY